MSLPARVRRIRFGWTSLIFASVFLLRLANLARLSRSPFLLPSGRDMYFYNDWAQRILRGEGAHLAFYGLPGYAYLLALLYKSLGFNPFVPGFLQAILDGGTSVLIYLLALRILSPQSTTGASNDDRQVHARIFSGFAALGWAFFVPAEAYSVVLMPTAWFVFIFWFVVWRIVRKTDAPEATELCLLGILIGLTATAVANILLLVPLLFAALIFKSKVRENQGWRRLSLGTSLLFIGVGIGTAPCWIHNYVVERDPVFLSGHSGINFWIGNNPAANGYPRFPPGLGAGQAAMLQDSINQAESAAGRSLKYAEVSAYWSAKAKAYILSHLVDWLKLLGLKARNFWNAFQYDDLSIITDLREQGVIFPGCYFGLVSALAIPGIFLASWFSSRSRWIIAAIFCSMAGLLSVFVTERYRLVAVPGLLIFCGFGLSLFRRSIRENRLNITAVYIILLAASVAFVSVPQRDPSLWALDAYNSGQQDLELDDLTMAERKLAIAYAYVPDNTETLFALGNLRFAQTNSKAATAFYEAVLRLDPRHKGALNNLGVVSFQAENYHDAEQWFRRAKEVDPRNGKTRFLLAKTLLAEGEIEQARAEAVIATQFKGDQPEFKALLEQLRRDFP